MKFWKPDRLCNPEVLDLIDPKTTAHLIIDLQHFYFHPDKQGTDKSLGVANQIATIAPLFNQLGICKTFWIHHTLVDKKLLATPEPDDEILGKPAFSSFRNTGLDKKLRALGVDTLLISGGYTNWCVRDTIRDALRNRYNVFAMRDCIYPSQKRLRGAFTRHSFFGASQSAHLTISPLVLGHCEKKAESASVPQTLETNPAFIPEAPYQLAAHRL